MAPRSQLWLLTASSRSAAPSTAATTDIRVVELVRDYLVAARASGRQPGPVKLVQGSNHGAGTKFRR